MNDFDETQKYYCNNCGTLLLDGMFQYCAHCGDSGCITCLQNDYGQYRHVGCREDGNCDYA